MKISDITSVLEQAAPLVLQEDYDNSGLIVGRPDREISSALVCVDVTEEVKDEAEKLGAGLVISHHPLIFHSVRRLTGRDYVERIVERAVKKDIAIYACHTNLDAVKGGLSYRIASILGVENPRLLGDPLAADPTAGFGVVGELPQEAPTLGFLRTVMDRMDVKVVRHSDICRDTVRRVAICSGSGASLIETAAAAGADLYIAADFRYHDFMAADGRLVVADIGHFESEYCAIDLIYDIISKKFTTFALHKSRNSRNPVNYLA